MRALLAIALLLAAAPAFADGADGGVALTVYRTDAGALVEALPDGGVADVPPAEAIAEGAPSPYDGVVLPTARAKWIAGEVAADKAARTELQQAVDADAQMPPLLSTSTLVVGLVCLAGGLVGGVYLGIKLAK